MKIQAIPRRRKLWWFSSIILSFSENYTYNLNKLYIHENFFLENLDHPRRKFDYKILLTKVIYLFLPSEGQCLSETIKYCIIVRIHVPFFLREAKLPISATLPVKLHELWVYQKLKLTSINPLVNSFSISVLCLLLIFMLLSQVESYQRLKKWYLMSPCLTLSIIRWG